MLDTNFTELCHKSFKENWNENAFKIFNKDVMTYGEAAKKIAYLQEIFKTNGVKPGDKIAAVGQDSPHWCIVYLAVTLYGAKIVPILSDFLPSDVEHITNHSEAIMLFSDDDIFEELNEETLSNLIGIFSLKDFRLLFSLKKNFSDIIDKTKEVFNKKVAEGFTFEDLEWTEMPNDHIAAIVYTSGTTGFSKGVMQTFNSLVGNLLFAQNNVELDHNDEVIAILPLAHAYGCAFSFLFPITSGACVVFLGKKPSPKVILSAFQAVKPRFIVAVPLIIEKIYTKRIAPKLKTKPLQIFTAIPGLRKLIYKKIKNGILEGFGGRVEHLVIGGAAFNPKIEQFLTDIKFPMTVGYGMTECSPLITYSHWYDTKVGSVGKAIDVMEVRIGDPDPETNIGEIQTRGENVMVGYFNNEEATKATFTEDGWLKTGDLGIIDEDGFVFIKGRSKSMILGANGQNIYPEEIELNINNIHYVQESVVVERDKKLVALVYPDYEAVDANGGVVKLDDEAIIEASRKELNKELPPYSQISKVVIWPEEFQKTPSRKIKRYLYK
ncbi:MAG: AMP-binding protein [Kiritimatiellae bacterium]|jgi:long-chain acyl-CoA synthetase|nr:AMP-binding protein [Kiritimatiellia bacterium]